MGASDKKSEQTYLWLRSYIDENKFANNSKLPSENVISHRLSVSRETARTALARLAEEGLIRKVKGSGTYINKEVALTRELGGKAVRSRSAWCCKGRIPMRIPP